MWLLDQIVEQRVKEAQQQGQFTDLPGTGQPLQLDDDSMIPESLRVAYRILRNHGALPPEIVWRQEINSVQDLLRKIEQDDPANEVLRKRLRLLQLQVGIQRNR
jgi:Domain of unknown function (DUF1992).